MKLYKLFTALVATTLAAASCEQRENWGEAEMTSDTKELTFTQDGGSHTLQLTTSREWKVKCDADWIVVDPENGKASDKSVTVTVTVPANVGTNRSATVTLYGGVVAAYITVSQEGPEGDSDSVESVTVQEFINKADPDTPYRLTGTVSGKYTSTYTTFNLQDETGSILVYSFDSSSSIMSEADVQNGATVTIKGYYYYYTTKQQHEIKNAVIEAYTAPQGGGEQTDVQKISCADFISKADPNTTYRLVGEVTTDVNTKYCSFDMNDGTATVVVWTVNNASEWGNTVKKGGTVTVRGKYMAYTDSNGTLKHEVVDAYIEDFKAGSSGDEQPSGSGEYASDISWTLGSNAYDHTSSDNSKQTATVNGTAVSAMLKLGKSSAAGVATLNVPAGTSKIKYYALAWKGSSATLQFTKDGAVIGTQAVRAEAGLSGNPPYTLSVTAADCYTLDLGGKLSASAVVSVTTTATARAVLFAIKAE